MVHNEIRRPRCSLFVVENEKQLKKTLICGDSPARIKMALADGSPEESLAALTGRSSVVFSSRLVAADGTRLVLIGHGRRVYLWRVDGLQIGLLAVHRHAVEVRFCYKSVSLNFSNIFIQAGVINYDPPYTSKINYCQIFIYV